MKMIGCENTGPEAKILSGLLLPARKFLYQEQVDELCRKAGHQWRTRKYGPMVTLLSCIQVALLEGGSTRTAEDSVFMLAPTPDKHADDPLEEPQRSGSDLCQARKRLPLSVFEGVADILWDSAADICGRFVAGRRVLVADGTTLRTPNTKANEECFGRANNSLRASGFPVARLMVLACSDSGAIMDYRITSFASGEWGPMMDMFGDVPKNSLVVLDAGLCGYMPMAYLVHKKSSDMLCRYGVNRSEGTLIRKLKNGDKIVRWTRSYPNKTSNPELMASLPETMDVRVITTQIERAGYRTYTLRLATTILDPEVCSREELIDAYLERWGVETVFRTLKQDYRIRQLRCKTPDTVRKEIVSTIAAHNLVAAISAESGVPPGWLSRKRVRKTIIETASTMSKAATLELQPIYDLMLRSIAGMRLQNSENKLPQPRTIRQRQTSFPVATESRQAWRERECVA